jgi:hypothetical protein
MHNEALTVLPAAQAKKAAQDPGRLFYCLISYF